MAEEFSVIRATETWQRAGAYYVRIQSMAKKHHITLRQEFDGMDTPLTKYVLALDGDFPVGTARLVLTGDSTALVGRVVVLPEYRHKGIGTSLVRACETWALEAGRSVMFVESRDNKVDFYRQMGYRETGDPPIEGEVFRCVRMRKDL